MATRNTTRNENRQFTPEENAQMQANTESLRLAIMTAHRHNRLQFSEEGELSYTAAIIVSSLKSAYYKEITGMATAEQTDAKIESILNPTSRSIVPTVRCR